MSLSSARRLLYRLADKWPAKVLSIALALALVAVYRVSNLSTRTITVPLAVEAPGDLIPASPLPEGVRVRLRGEEAGVRAIAEGDIEAFADLSGRQGEGWARAQVQVRRRGAALEVEPLEVSARPPEISVRLDRRATATLPLAAPMQGSVAYGFDLVSRSLTPGEVTVSGPAGAIAYLTEIATSPVALDGRSADFAVAVAIASPSPLISIAGPGSAEFRGVVRPAVPVRSVSGAPIALEGLPPWLTASAAPAAGGARIEGSWEQIDAFSPGPGFLYADASGISEPGLHLLPVRARLPHGLSLARLDPETVSVRAYPSPPPPPAPTQAAAQAAAPAAQAQSPSRRRRKRRARQGSRRAGRPAARIRRRRRRRAARGRAQERAQGRAQERRRDRGDRD